MKSKEEEGQLSAPKKEYQGISRANGPLVFVEKTDPVGYGELVHCTDKDGAMRMGQVLDTSDEVVAVQLFEGTSGLDLPDTRIEFLGEPLKLGVSDQMLGRVFNGMGEPIDGGAPIASEQKRDINGLPLNPISRSYPENYVQTGISVIDCMSTLIRGQKLPIFSGDGFPHDALAAQIARQASVPGAEEDFAIVFAAMGVKHDIAQFFTKSFEESGRLKDVAFFLTLADQPSIERILTPRSALTLAEYLAFEKNMHVLVILTDMTNYCEAVREVSSLRGEIPSRKGFPGYLYSDLAEIYERSGMVHGKKGSITQLPILTMPNDDISHPVPDLTGYITEGQIVFDRTLLAKNIFPPVGPLASLSRLMKDGIGEGKTRKDHPHLASQLFASYSTVQDVRNLASVIGEEELSAVDHQYLEFGDAFELEFLKQGPQESRTMEESLNLAWHVLSRLPREELTTLREEEIEAHYEQR